MMPTRMSLSRPGNLIQDIRPMRNTRRRVDVIQPESRHQPKVSAVHRAQPIKQISKPSRKKILQIFKINKLVLIAPLIVIASMQLASLPLVGEGIIVLYGLLAAVLRIPSRVSFWLATVVLAGIGIRFLLLPGVGSVNNSALFVFLLLCVGLASSTYETRRMVLRDKL
ncbi:hypothetical protein H7X68_00630 [Candidatus Saccharibacteria bacterium]|nr:hypothetical protein [Candidatus Saccharibacteria bacterium]